MLDRVVVGVVQSTGVQEVGTTGSPKIHRRVREMADNISVKEVKAWFKSADPEFAAYVLRDIEESLSGRAERRQKSIEGLKKAREVKAAKAAEDANAAAAAAATTGAVGQAAQQ